MPEWTAQQQTAIESTGENILVNAAAGSGKTAVLVERIIQKITDEKNPTDIDRLLVATFTNAAAAEMKGRISEALEKKLRENPTDGAVKKQLLLLKYADITTIDSFCLNVVRNNFHLLDIDPNFSIADESELSLLKNEVVDELFDELYEAENADFLLLAETYARGRSDGRLKEEVFEISRFVSALANPKKWFDDAREMYLFKDGFENSAFVKEIADRISIYSGECIAELDEAVEFMFGGSEIRLAYESKVNEPYTGDAVLSKEAVKCRKELYKKLPEVFLEWKTVYENIRRLIPDGWDRVYEYVSGVSAPSYSVRQFATVRSGRYDELKTRAAELFEDISLTVSMKSADIEKLFKEKLYPILCALSSLVQTFDERLLERKKKKNSYGFADIERFCLELLVDENGNRTELADALREKYAEILLDEYQDSNGLQEEIFQSISDGNNMFMVGDMKQSIYRFRQSDPKLFKAKNDTYSACKGTGGFKIILSQNFRSRSRILSSVNEIFENVMSEYAGEINYDDEQRLNYGSKIYDTADDENTELIIIDNDRAKDDALLDENGLAVGKREIEARTVARRIKKLTEDGFEVTQKDGSKRPLEYRDIAILLRAPGTDGKRFADALKKEGIEAFVISDDYFEKQEVNLVLSLMKTILNPKQDIPFIAVMRSVIWNFSDDELARVRMCAKGKMYDAAAECAKEDTELGRKCMRALDDLKRWRGYSKYMSSDKLVWKLYTETDYYAYVGALAGGEECRANLRLIYERAKQYEKSGFRGLFNFINLIERMIANNEKINPAKLITEKHNVVQIKSMHKSKGLEYPVTIISAADKAFSIREKNSVIMLHKELGFGMDYINRKAGYICSTISKSAHQKRFETESVSEEMRILYVAMTRAREKLIVTGTVDGLEKKLPLWDCELPLKKMRALNSKSFLNLIAPVALKSKLWEVKTVKTSEFEITPDEKVQPQERVYEDSDVDIDELFGYEYKYKKLGAIASKVSVTEMKERFGEEEDGTVYYYNQNELAVPEFLKEERVTNARRGTLTHLAMQNIVFKENADLEYVMSELDRMVSENIMTQSEKELVYSDKIAKFFASELGKRAVRAKRLYRESPFEIEIPVSEVRRELGEEYNGEKVILQGVIDGYFEEDGEIVIFDYKTDKYSDKTEIAQKYKLQLAYYKTAVERITHKRVKECVLYLFFKDDMLVLGEYI